MPDSGLSRAIPALAALVLLAACGDSGQTEQAAGNASTAAPLLYNGAASAGPREEEPEKLLGLETDAIQGLLGDPTLVRRDGDAEVWQYRSTGCVLDLFIYGQPKRVEHVDLRNRGEGAPDAVRACFAAMLRGEIPTS